MTIARRPIASIEQVDGLQGALQAMPAPPTVPRAVPTWADFFQPGHSWEVYNSTDADLNNSAVYYKGVQSARVKAPANSAGGVTIRGLDPIDLTGKCIRVTFRVSDIANATSVELRVGTGGTLHAAQSIRFRLWEKPAAAQSYVQSGEWVTVTVGWDDVVGVVGTTYTWTAAGGPSATSGFTDINLRVASTASAQAEIYVQAVEILPVSTAFPNGVVSVTFDDGGESVFSKAKPILDVHGWRATNYLIHDLIDEPGYLTTSQVEQLSEQGWENGYHAYASALHTSPGLPGRTAEDVQEDMRLMRRWLAERPSQGLACAYPYGNFAPTTDGTPVDSIAARHFQTARTISSLTLEKIPPAMPRRLLALTAVSSFAAGPAHPTTLTAAGGKIDLANRYGSWLILVFHDVVADGTTLTNSGQIHAADFAAILSDIAGRGMAVLPVSEVIARAE